MTVTAHIPFFKLQVGIYGSLSEHTLINQQIYLAGVIVSVDKRKRDNIKYIQCNLCVTLITLYKNGYDKTLKL